MAIEAQGGSSSSVEAQESTLSLKKVLRFLGDVALVAGGTVAMGVGLGTMIDTLSQFRPELSNGPLPSLLEFFQATELPNWLIVVSFLGSTILTSMGAAAIQWSVGNLTGDTTHAAETNLTSEK